MAMLQISKRYAESSDARWRRALLLTAIVVTTVCSFVTALAQDELHSPWPMYRHDAQHTDRSAFVGIVHDPLIVTTLKYSSCDGYEGGYIIGNDGHTVYGALHGCLFAFDLFLHKFLWQSAVHGCCRSVPALSDEDTIVWGAGNTFYALDSAGNPLWSTGSLDSNFVFGSSPVIDNAGNIYFTHDGFFSIATDGKLRWIHPYPEALFSHGSPAIGSDGTIYNTDYTTLYAYNRDGSIQWSAKPNFPPCQYASCAFMNNSSPVLGPEDTIFINFDSQYEDYTVSPPSIERYAGLYAYQPDGAMKWHFAADLSYAHSPLGAPITTSPALASDGSLIFGLVIPGAPWVSAIYAVDQNGRFKWQYQFPANFRLFQTVTLDAQNNAYVCGTYTDETVAQGECYAISGEGEILWQKLIPTSGIYIAPFILRDGIVLVTDISGQIYVLIDPSVIPIPVATPASLLIHVPDPTNLASGGVITETVLISSTVRPIAWTVHNDTTSWLAVSVANGANPGALTLSIAPHNLAIGQYQSVIYLKTSGEEILSTATIPVTLQVGHLQYLPFIALPSTLNASATVLAANLNHLGKP